MGFENFQQKIPDGKPLEEGAPKGEGDGIVGRIKRRFQKAVALTALGTTLVGTEGCKPENFDTQQGGKPKTTERGGTSRSPFFVEHDQSRRVVNEINNDIFKNTRDLRLGKINENNIKDNPFLKDYYLYVENSHKVLNGAGGNRFIELAYYNIVATGEEMRALEHAWKAGMKPDLTGNIKWRIVTKGNVVVEASINGIRIPILPSNFTEVERESLENLKDAGLGNVESGYGHENQKDIYGGGMNTPRQSPDFDKDPQF